jgi:predicted  nucleic acid-binding Zn-ribbon protein
MAPVENGVCTGCYVALRPQQRVQLNGGTIVFCSSCGRLLYLAQ